MAAFVHHAIAKSGGDDGDKPNPMEQMSEMFGPGHVDQVIKGEVTKGDIHLFVML